MNGPKSAIGTAEAVSGAEPHFSPVTEAGRLVFVSGQLGFNSGGVIEGDVVQQTSQCLWNIADCLRARGLGLTDVVKTTVWIRRQEDFAPFNDTYAAIFGRHRPARSTLVCALARPEALVEIEAIADAGAALS